MFDKSPALDGGARIIGASPIVQKLHADLRGEVKTLGRTGLMPKLTVLLVGDQPASVWSARNKARVGAKVGLLVEIVELPSSTTEAVVIDRLERLNADPSVHGILVELPLPRSFSKATVLNSIAPAKDVDGVTATNRGYLLGGQEDRGLLPPTPLSCLALIESAGESPGGKDITVVGRGDTVGRPLAVMLLNRHATVTICHTKTSDLGAKCRQASIIVAAAGVPRLIGREMVSPGTLVIDAGVNSLPDGSFTGDVDFEAVKTVAKGITPVPGGVGLLTSTIVMVNTIKAMKLQVNGRLAAGGGTEMSLFDKTVREFLQLAGARSPTPGGGSVSAVTAALAASMVAMVANLTLGKRGYEEAQSTSRDALAKSEAAIAELELLAAQDIEAFECVMAAWRMPSETNFEKEAKAEAISAAAENASRVPLRICSSCIDILVQAAFLAPVGTKSAISDVAVAANLAHAALNAALLSVDANLPSIDDEAVRSTLLRERDDLLSRAGSLKQTALDEISRRL